MSFKKITPVKPHRKPEPKPAKKHAPKKHAPRRPIGG
ncbi:MAG: hypothetical protein QOI83_1370 [Streptomycetaceae bacterium]|nr:hypothetical protein [Streptomycetaceae bacterium]